MSFPRFTNVVGTAGTLDVTVHHAAGCDGHETADSELMVKVASALSTQPSVEEVAKVIKDGADARIDSEYAEYAAARAVLAKFFVRAAITLALFACASIAHGQTTIKDQLAELRSLLAKQQPTPQ